MILCWSKISKGLELADKSVALMVTSPPYNIDIDYGYKWKNRKVVASKGAKYSDKLDESEYREMLKQVLSETKRVLADDGQLCSQELIRVGDNWVVRPL